MWERENSREKSKAAGRANLKIRLMPASRDFLAPRRDGRRERRREEGDEKRDEAGDFEYLDVEALDDGDAPSFDEDDGDFPFEDDLLD